MSHGPDPLGLRVPPEGWPPYDPPDLNPYAEEASGMTEREQVAWLVDRFESDTANSRDMSTALAIIQNTLAARDTEIAARKRESEVLLDECIRLRARVAEMETWLREHGYHAPGQVSELCSRCCPLLIHPPSERT